MLLLPRNLERSLGSFVKGVFKLKVGVGDYSVRKSPWEYSQETLRSLHERVLPLMENREKFFPVALSAVT